MYPKNFIQEPLSAASLGNGCPLTLMLWGEMVPGPTENHNEFYSDDIDLVRRIMEDMFIPLFLDEQAYHRIGFINISRRICELPGWYLWTKDDRGAYLLELTSLEIAEPISITNQSPFLTAGLVLKYYPTPEEPSFKDFAFLEQQVRLSPCFDHTGTPLFEKQEEIHDSLFTVGHICVAFDRELSIAKMRVSSQDRWVEFREDAVGVETDSGPATAPLMEKTRLRNVPGWELSWGFFDKLVLGFCYVHRSRPFGLRLMMSPASIYFVSGKGQCREVQTSEIGGWTLEVAVILQRGKKATIPPKGLWKSFPLPTNDGVLIVDSLENASEEKHPWINPDWWAVHSWSFALSEEIKHRCMRDH
jgi:hypothetical protein